MKLVTKTQKLLVVAYASIAFGLLLGVSMLVAYNHRQPRIDNAAAHTTANTNTSLHGPDTNKCPDLTKCYCAVDEIDCADAKPGDNQACVNGQCKCFRFVTCAQVKADDEKNAKESVDKPIVPTTQSKSQDVPVDPSYSAVDIKAQISEEVARETTINARMGVKMKVTAKQMVALAKCESTWRPKTISPNGLWFGLYQWRPQDIPGGAQCALDLSCSTIATIDAINRGETWRWPTCWSKSV